MRIVPSHFVPSRPPAPMQKHAPRMGAPTSFVAPSAGWPILLYDSVIVQSGGEQEFRSEAFTNNLPQVIGIRSMRVNLVGGVGASTATNAGGLIALALSLDGVPMTRGPVPVWSMCRSDSRADEIYSNSRVASFAWHFPFPIPLGPGKTITASAKHLGLVPQSITAGVSFSGDLVTGMMPPRRVPFAFSWTSGSFAYTEARTDSIPPAALANALGRDLHVERIIGRSIAYNNVTGAAPAATPEFRDYDDLSLQGVNSLLVRMSISKQAPILRTYTPWRAVFGQNAAVETQFIMRPGDYLAGDVQHIAGPVLGTPLVFSQSRGELSLVGWRDA